MKRKIYKHEIRVLLNSEQKEFLDQAAPESDRSISGYVRVLIQKDMNRKKLLDK